VGGSTGSVLPTWLENWFIFFLLYNNFIPISLYVTIELVNIGQVWKNLCPQYGAEENNWKAYLVGSDIELYDEELDHACTIKSSNLAQVWLTHSVRSFVLSICTFDSLCK
jgi:hypothetical protein